MSGGVVCYIERTPGGSGIKRLRLIAAGLSRQWTAPEPRSVSSVDAGVGSAAPSVSVARAGATWIAETLEGVGLRRLAAVCVDSEGSICAWLSSHSPESSAIRATISQSGADGDGSGAGLGAARLLAGADPAGAGLGFLAETSVQALATLEPDIEPGRPALPGKAKSKGSPAAGLGRKHRYAVLAIQDAIVRVLLDELDTRGIEVDRVVSLWHAMASGWDRVQAASLTDRLVSTDSPGGAVIMVEPNGRLVWAWTRAGELVAGGAMRLAAHSRRLPAAAGTQQGGSAGAGGGATGALAPLNATIGDDDEPNAAASVTLEFSTAEAGRLAVDWLSWSAQLGHCPQRVVCLSAPNVTDGSLGPEALFAHLAKSWPGATIDGAVHEDPVGATIGRLAGLGPETRKLLPEEIPASALLPYHDRPREALTDLSSRPGKADRRLHQWIGVALVAAAALVAIVGWQIRSSVGAAKDLSAQAWQTRKALLKEAEKYSERVSEAAPTKQVEALQTALTRLQDQRKYLKEPRPMIEEAVRVFIAMADVNAGIPAAPAPVPAPAPAPKPAPGAPTIPGAPATAPTSPPAAPQPTRTTLNELELSPIACKVSLIVPDAETGPNILDKIQQNPYVLNWSGSSPGSFGPASTGTGRQYLLIATWPDSMTPAKKPAPGTAAPSAAPTSTPAATPTSKS